MVMSADESRMQQSILSNTRRRNLQISVHLTDNKPQL